MDEAIPLEIAGSIAASAIILYGAEFLHRNISGFYYSKIKFKSSIPRHEFHRIYRYLNKNFAFFKPLSHKGRTEFINRVWQFKRQKYFYGREGLKVTEEMKYLVSASAAQLTFGLSDFTISSHNTINLYPGTFYLPGMRQKMKGATTESGQIHLSVEDLKKGYSVPDDRYNLGLHEVAHALKLAVLNNNSFDKRFMRYFAGWKKTVHREFIKLKHGDEHFLREYGGRNMHEFFAVCAEHFFEVPDKMKRAVPELYNSLCLLLNQDTTRKAHDYRVSDNLKKKFPELRAARAKVENISWHWSLSVFTAGLLCILPAFILKEFFLISRTAFYSLCFGVSAVAFGAHYTPVFKANIMGLNIYLLYLIAGVTPLFVTILFIVNLLFPVTDIKYVKLKLEKYKNIRDFGIEATYYYIPEGASQRIYYTRDIYGIDTKTLRKADMTVGYKRGVLGYKTVYKTVLTKGNKVYDIEMPIINL